MQDASKPICLPINHLIYTSRQFGQNIRLNSTNTPITHLSLGGLAIMTIEHCANISWIVARNLTFPKTFPNGERRLSRVKFVISCGSPSMPTIPMSTFRI
jgi:hypothetical protein